MAITIPTYLALADDLERGLAALRPGDRLPSEYELVARHEVSRITARTAVQELERRHLVRRVRGSGTYVARRLAYRIADATPSWSETVRQAGAEPLRRVLGVGRLRPPPEVAEALDRPRAQRVVAISRLGTVDGLVADLATSWLPSDLVTDLDGFLHDGDSLYDALVAAGASPRRRWTTAELAAVPPEVAPQLELEGRPLVWRVISCNEDAVTGRAVEYADGWMRPDVYRITLELGRRS